MDNTYYHRTKSDLEYYDSPNYGEWYDWKGTISWDENELDPNNVYFVFYIDEVDPDVDISIDTFRISLPSKKSFSDPDNLCGELVINGDAEVRHHVKNI